MEKFQKPYTWGDLNLNDTPELKSLIEDAEELRKVAMTIGDSTSIHRGRFGHQQQVQ